MFRRVVDEVTEFCRRQAPSEALGVLVGHRCQYEGQRYVRVVDWATGTVDASASHARFTPEGVAQYHVELDEKYGADRAGPHVVGIFHSHPFGGEPQLSATDLATFGEFPYAAAGNVFVLVNPLSGHFLVFQRDEAGELRERSWTEYEPRAIEAETDVG